MKYLLLIVTLIGLFGCESMLLDKGSTQAKKEAANVKFLPEQKAAVYVKSPDMYQEVKLRNEPAWLDLPVTPVQSAAGIPMTFIMQKVLGNNGINYIFSDDIENPNLTVSVNLKGRVRDALQDISHVTGFSYTVVGNTVNWSSYITKTFNVSYIPGKYNYMVGSAKESSQNSGSGDAEQIEFGGTGQEHSSVTGVDVDAFAEITNVTNQIVSEYGSVAASASTSSIIVTTTKARMQLVENYFDTVEKKLGRQIAFVVRLIRFTSNISSEAGVNWNLLKQEGADSLVFNGGNLTNMIEGSPITFSAKREGGEYDGSTALISALEKQGDTSIISRNTIVTQPNRIAELELSELQGYIARTEVTPSSSLTSSEPTVSLRQGIVESGYKLYALGNIGDNDKIILHLSNTYIPKPEIVRKEVETSAIESPNLTRSRNVSTVVLRNGQTMMIAGLIVETASDQNESPLSARFLPTRKAKSSTKTEIIALVTPVIVDMN